MNISSVESMLSQPSRQSAGGPQDAGPAATFKSNPVSSKTTTSTAEDVKAAPTPEAIAKTINNINDSFTRMGHDLYASYKKDKITGIEVVQFHDKKTSEVIRQVPSKELLAIAQSLSLPPGIQGQLIYDKA
ncbi:MAG TPA: flagellar protein FlaG [Sulfuricella sp.]|nr:flagellar protein FlaG [Sulfuricella sp.]